MSNKDEGNLIKLAKMAGYDHAKTGLELCGIGKGYGVFIPDLMYVLKKGDLSNLDPIEHIGYRYFYWNPYEKADQAFEVLNAWQLNNMYEAKLLKSQNDVHLCSLHWHSEGNNIISHVATGYGNSYSEAISDAIIAAEK